MNFYQIRFIFILMTFLHLNFKYLFCRELPNYQLMDEYINGEMVILQGITSSWMMNPQDEWDSARNYLLIDEESPKRGGFCRELPAH
jgi:hypothetical protein